MVQNIRALYLGANRSWMIPYTDLVLSAIGAVTQLDRFGPGYVSPAELEAGVHRWEEARAPYDMILTDSIILECEKKIQLGPYRRDAVFHYHLDQYTRHAPALREHFLNHTARKIFIADWDTYKVSDARIAELVAANAFTTAFHDKNSTLSLDQLRQYGDSLLPGSNDNWFRYVTNHADRIISLPHFVHSQEFVFTPLTGRPYRYTVPGTGYSERRAAKRLLTTAELCRDRCRALVRYCTSIRWYRRQLRNDKWLLLLRFRFANAIAKSKMCFVSGSSARTPVRKYFEIPAKGSVMVCQPFAGFEHLGFKHGENCFVAESIAAIQSVLDGYNETEYQRIADKGRRLVWELHAERAREMQLRESFVRILDGSFEGSCWDHGAYVFQNGVP